MPLIISADEIKKELPHYSLNKVEEFHHESATIVDKMFIKALKEYAHNEVILLKISKYE